MVMTVGRLVNIVLLVPLCFSTPCLSEEEQEPNNSATEANSLLHSSEQTGSITPIMDQDFFSIPGINKTWGFIALLETDQSTQGKAGVLTALGNDGVTILQSDAGSWHKGSGIALQNFADGRQTHFFSVKEEGDNETISKYVLKYYTTIVKAKAEGEPNDTVMDATPSSYTHAGSLETISDSDCFVFQGHEGDDFLIAANGDPENDGHGIDLRLDLKDGKGTTLASADHSGINGNEFIEYENLPADGIYAYCVGLTSGTPGSGANYLAGLIRNYRIYSPEYVNKPTLLNPRYGNTVYLGDTVKFELSLTNTSPLPIPEDILLDVRFDPSCLRYLGAEHTPSYIDHGYITWTGIKDGLEPGEKHAIVVEFEAISECQDTVRGGHVVEYYFSGSSREASYAITTGFPWSLYLHNLQQKNSD